LVEEESKSAVSITPSTLGATMLADLDLLLTAVFCTADDLLPEKAKNARRSVTDAEVVTLAVAPGDHGGQLG
jgi:metal-sulfur cluster biosynthetic enzyme